MGISDLAVHNVLRTYSRQDRLAKLSRQTTKSPPPASDKVVLSPKAQKFALLGRIADELVSLDDPEGGDNSRQEKIHGHTQGMFEHFKEELENASISPEEFEAQLREKFIPA
jgi:hypothetical protein